MYWLLQIQEGIGELAVWTFKLKQELLAGHFWTVTASEDSSLLSVPNCLTLTTAKGRLGEASFSSAYSIKGAKTFLLRWELGIRDKLAGKGKHYQQRKWENAEVKITQIPVLFQGRNCLSSRNWGSLTWCKLVTVPRGSAAPARSCVPTCWFLQLHFLFSDPSGTCL